MGHECYKSYKGDQDAQGDKGGLERVRVRFCRLYGALLSVCWQAIHSSTTRLPRCCCPRPRPFNRLLHNTIEYSMIQSSTSVVQARISTTACAAVCVATAQKAPSLWPPFAACARGANTKGSSVAALMRSSSQQRVSGGPLHARVPAENRVASVNPCAYKMLH